MDFDISRCHQFWTQEHGRKSSQLPGCLRSTVFELESEVATVAAVHLYVFFFSVEKKWVWIHGQVVSLEVMIWIKLEFEIVWLWRWRQTDQQIQWGGLDLDPGPYIPYGRQTGSSIFSKSFLKVRWTKVDNRSRKFISDYPKVIWHTFSSIGGSCVNVASQSIAKVVGLATTSHWWDMDQSDRTVEALQLCLLLINPRNILVILCYIPHKP